MESGHSRPHSIRRRAIWLNLSGLLQTPSEVSAGKVVLVRILQAIALGGATLDAACCNQRPFEIALLAATLLVLAQIRLNSHNFMTAFSALAIDDVLLRSGGLSHAETASIITKVPIVNSFEIMVGLLLCQAKPIVCLTFAKRGSCRTGSSNGSFLNCTSPASRSARACSSSVKAASFRPHWVST